MPLKVLGKDNIELVRQALPEQVFARLHLRFCQFVPAESIFFKSFDDFLGELIIDIARCADEDEESVLPRGVQTNFARRFRLDEGDYVGVKETMKKCGWKVSYTDW